MARCIGAGASPSLFLEGNAQKIASSTAIEALLFSAKVFSVNTQKGLSMERAAVLASRLLPKR